MTQLDPGLNFRSIARKELRSLMVGTGQPDYASLVNVLSQEAASIGIDLNAWPYDVAAPYQDEVDATMAEVQRCYGDWVAHGKPTPPPITGF